MEERDKERERRWKAEQAVKKLTEQVKGLQTRATEEKELQSLALHTTDRSGVTKAFPFPKKEMRDSVACDVILMLVLQVTNRFQKFVPQKL